LAYKTYPVAGPPEQTVELTVQAVATPEARLYPGEATAQVAAADNQAHPVTTATHEPAQFPVAYPAAFIVHPVEPEAAMNWYPVAHE